MGGDRGSKSAIGQPKCLLCGCNATFEFSKHEHGYYRCPCGFVFIWPRPSDEQLWKIYQSDGENYWTTETMVKFAFSPTKSLREIMFLRQFASSGSLLDIGCSTGSFVKAAIASGFRAEGIDICRPAVEIGVKLGLPLRVCDVLREDIEMRYDIVTLWATLEHLPDPRGTLQQVSALLRPAGLLLISVPNYVSLTQRVLKRWYRYVCSEHLNYFTPKVLMKAMESSGFDPVGQTTFGFNPLLIAKDLANRGQELNACERMATDEAQTLRLKESPLGHFQRAAEKVLNVFVAGDVLAAAAIKP